MNIKKLSILLVSLFIISTGFAQKKTVQTDNLLFLLRQPEHITQALKTIDQLKTGAVKSKSIKVGKVALIVCGEAIKNFAGNSDNEMIVEANRLGVTMYGCGLSLKKFDLTKDDLMPGIKYIENGFVKGFELQKLGYLSIEL